MVFVQVPSGKQKGTVYVAYAYPNTNAHEKLKEVPDSIVQRMENAMQSMLRAGLRVKYESPDYVPEVPREIVLRAVAGVDAVILLLTCKVDEEFYDAAGDHLKVVANTAVGTDNIDKQIATNRGILVTNTPGVLTYATADLTCALILATSRRVVQSHSLVVNGGWNQPWYPFGEQQSVSWGVRNKTLGVVGAGRIGTQVALSMHSGFGMRIFYTDLEANRILDALPGTQRVDLKTLLREADVVTLHTQLDENTKGLIGEEELGLMKPSAIIVNTSRGPVLDFQALIKALKERKIGGAGLDVFEKEPFNPLTAGIPPEVLAMMTFTAHIASAELDTRANMVEMAVDNTIRALRGDFPPQVVPEQAGLDPAIFRNHILRA